MGKFVTAVNVRGDKQTIPAHWLDHPTLGAGFRLPRSASRRRSPEPVDRVEAEPTPEDVPEQG